MKGDGDVVIKTHFTSYDTTDDITYSRSTRGCAFTVRQGTLDTLSALKGTQCETSSSILGYRMGDVYPDQRDIQIIHVLVGATLGMQVPAYGGSKKRGQKSTGAAGVLQGDTLFSQIEHEGIQAIYDPSISGMKRHLVCLVDIGSYNTVVLYIDMRCAKEAMLAYKKALAGRRLGRRQERALDTYQEAVLNAIQTLKHIL